MTETEDPKPKDLGIKIGTHEEAFWTKVKDGATAQIQNMKRQILIEEAVLAFALTRIKLEERRPK